MAKCVIKAALIFFGWKHLKYYKYVERVIKKFTYGATLGFIWGSLLCPFEEYKSNIHS